MDLGKVEQIFFHKMTAVWKKFSFLACFFGNSEFFKNSKITNFDPSVVEAIEDCLKNIHTKFQINRFIRTWDIVHANSKKVVSRKTRLKFWDKFPAILLTATAYLHILNRRFLFYTRNLPLLQNTHSPKIFYGDKQCWRPLMPLKLGVQSARCELRLAWLRTHELLDQSWFLWYLRFSICV